MTAAEYLEMDAGEVAVRAETREKARAYITGLTGIDYADLRVRKRWLRVCDCEGCEERGADRTHGYDEFWIDCEKDDARAVEWWVG